MSPRDGFLKAGVSCAAFLGGLAPTDGWAQAPAQPSGGITGTSGTGGAMVLLGIVAAVVLAIAVVAKFFDLRRKRETEAVLLQAQVTDMLLREERLRGLSVTATARVPFWSGSPATIDLAGSVPTPDLHETVLRLARSEAMRVRQDVVLEDRVAVVAPRRVSAA